jgi:hypothetical protein
MQASVQPKMTSKYPQARATRWAFNGTINTDAMVASCTDFHEYRRGPWRSKKEAIGPTMVTKMVT